MVTTMVSGLIAVDCGCYGCLVTCCSLVHSGSPSGGQWLAVWPGFGWAGKTSCPLSVCGPSPSRGCFLCICLLVPPWVGSVVVSGACGLGFFVLRGGMLGAPVAWVLAYLPLGARGCYDPHLPTKPMTNLHTHIVANRVRAHIFHNIVQVFFFFFLHLCLYPGHPKNHQEMP